MKKWTNTILAGLFVAAFVVSTIVMIIVRTRLDAAL